MPSTVVASRSPGIGIVAAVGLALLVVSACGQAGSATAAATGPGPTPAEAASSSVQATASPGATPRPTRTPRPTLPPAADLGDRLVATIDGVKKPCAMAATADAIWVTGNSPSRLARVDPATDTVVEQVPMAGSPCGIAVGPDGRLWVALLSVGQVVAIDPATGTVVATVRDLGSQLWDLKAGYGSIWVVDRSNRQLLRIDPASATVIDRLAIGPSGSGLAVTGAGVWVVDDVDGSVRRVDPMTMTVTSTTKLGRGASWFADDGHEMLVANRVDGSIVPFDASSAAPMDPIGGASSPLDGTVLGGRAYIPDAARRLIEIDLASGSIAAVDALDGALNPFVAEVAFGDVWVLDYGGERIWRIKP